MLGCLNYSHEGWMLPFPELRSLPHPPPNRQSLMTLILPLESGTESLDISPQEALRVLTQDRKKSRTRSLPKLGVNDSGERVVLVGGLHLQRHTEEPHLTAGSKPED